MCIRGRRSALAGLCAAAVRRDPVVLVVIEIWVVVFSGTGVLLSTVSALLRWDCLCNITAIARGRLRAHKGPLHVYYVA